MTTTLAAEQPHRTARLPHPAAYPGVEDPGGPADRERAVIPMLFVDHADEPEDAEVLHELAEHGLRRYTARITAAVGAGAEAAWCEWADAPSAYIALDQRLPDHPDQDAALVWAAERGWAVAVETGRGEDLLITASRGGDVLPAPDTVATWLRAVLTGTSSDARRDPGAAVTADVIRRLADWAGRDPDLDGRHG